MTIWKRIGKIIAANIYASLGTQGQKVNPRRPFSETRTENHRNQTSGETSNLKDPKLEKAYAALEIPYGADFQTAKTAWKKLLKKYHPDLFSNDPAKAKIAHEVTQGLNEAFQTIRLALNKNQ